MIKLIGIRGKKGHGKDEAFKAIASYYGPEKVIKWNFATPLKQEIAQAIGQPIKYIDEHKVNFRLILQGWGTDYRRKMFGEQYWITKWLRGYHNITSIKPESIIVATDVRFKNELEMIEKEAGIVMKVIAFNKLEPEVDTHQSECDLDDVPCKIQIPNIFPKKELLHERVKAILKSIENGEQIA